MSLKYIYLTRHGFRSNWVVDPKTGEYATNIPSPTGIASDPALASYGVQQSEELATYVQDLLPPAQRIYSSPFYRCIQTITPTCSKLSEKLLIKDVSSGLKIHGENGLGEWFGTARFDHPSPAEPAVLKKFFSYYDDEYQPYIKPNTCGETIDELHDRCAYALHRIIERSDREGVEAILICTHAATLIAIGRVLTGFMPDDVTEEDFIPFTCSLSTFERKNPREPRAEIQEWAGPGTQIPYIDWKNQKGVGGSSWQVTKNCDCSFLSGGEERGWKFSGNESFTTSNSNSSLDAGVSLGVIIEGKRSEATSGSSML